MFALLKLIPLREWAYIGCIAGLLLGAWWFIAHERGIGKAQCETAVAKAQSQADARAEELQKRLDAIAAEDAGLRAAATAVPAPYSRIQFACSLTPAELAKIRERIK
jgi:hypothetical protein